MKDTAPKPFVFVLMPFAKEFNDVYSLGIKPGCEAAGFYCERVDEQIYEETMLERIYNQISKADIIVSDMTGQNSNVFYETGYAHALGKRVVLLTKNSDDIPFDLKHHFHIVYGNSISGMKSDLEKRMKWFAKNPVSKSEPNEKVAVYFNGEKLSLYNSICFYMSKPMLSKFEISINNTSNILLESKKIKVAVEISGDVNATLYRKFSSKMTTYNKISLPNGGFVYNLDKLPDMMPDYWYKEYYSIDVISLLLEDRQIDLRLHVYLESGRNTYPFSIVMTDAL